MAGEASAKAEFASASRRIAADFDALRETAKNEHARAKSEAGSALEAGKRKAANEHTEALKPLSDALRARRRLPRAPGRARRRLPQVQAQPGAAGSIPGDLLEVREAGRRAVRPPGQDGPAPEDPRGADHPQDA